MRNYICLKREHEKSLSYCPMVLVLKAIAPDQILKRAKSGKNQYIKFL